jgi:hypothetical protein
MMAYCTTTDVYLEAGTATGTATVTDIGNMITRSDEEIASYLIISGVSPPTSSDDLKTASIALTIAKLKRRQSHELSRPGSLNLGGDISFSVSPDQEIKALEDKARVAMNQYINSLRSGNRVSRVRGRCR